MAIALVDSHAQGSTDRDGFTLSAIDATGANFLAHGMAQENTANGVITDDEFNSYTEIAGPTSFASAYASFWYSVNPSVSSTLVVSVSGTDNGPSVVATAWSGVDTASPLDQTSSGNSNIFSSTVQPGSITPTTNNQLILAVGGGIGPDGGPDGSMNGGFTIAGQINLQSSIHCTVVFGYLIQTTAAAANPTFTFSGGLTLSAKSASFEEGAGGGGITGSGAITTPTIEVAGTGERTVTGSGAVSLSPVTVDGTGERTVTGSGAITLDSVQVAGTGAVGGVVTGSGAITVDATQVSGTGERVITGSGAVTLSETQVSGAGIRTSTGSGAILLASIEVSGTGSAGGVGAGSIVTDEVTMSGVGERISSGGGQILLDSVQVLGAGSVVATITGSGALTLSAVLVSGSGGGIIVEGQLLTIFLSDVEPVPDPAYFNAGIAYSSDNYRYVCNWPASNEVSWLKGQAIRNDGAQCILAGTDVTDIHLNGLRYTTRGEVRVSTSAPDFTVAGYGMVTGDMMSMSEIA